MRDVIICSSIIGAVVLSALGADDTPQRLPFDRYNGMVTRSPFAVATAVALPAATPNFAKDLYVANAAHTDTADFVTVVSAADKNLREYLSTEKPNDHGFGISNIQWSDKPGETKVTITKDGQFATLSFNQALIQAPVPMGPNAGAVPPPANVAPMPNAIPPAQANIPRPPAPVPQNGAATLPTPHVRGLIQRNPSTAPNQPNQPQAEQ